MIAKAVDEQLAGLIAACPRVCSLQSSSLSKTAEKSEERLRRVVHRKAGRLGLPTEVTAVEQSQANGRAEQRVRALRERLQIMVEDARRRSAEIILDHPVAQWAVTSRMDPKLPCKERCGHEWRWNNQNHAT